MSNNLIHDTSWCNHFFEFALRMTQMIIIFILFHIVFYLLLRFWACSVYFIAFNATVYISILVYCLTAESNLFWNSRVNARIIRIRLKPHLVGELLLGKYCGRQFSQIIHRYCGDVHINRAEFTKHLTTTILCISSSLICIFKLHKYTWNVTVFLLLLFFFCNFFSDFKTNAMKPILLFFNNNNKPWIVRFLSYYAYVSPMFVC